MNEANLRIRIRENSRKAVSKIKKNFKKIDRSQLQARLRIKDEIAETRAKMKALEKDRTTEFKAKTDKKSLANVESQMQALSRGRGVLTDGGGGANRGKGLFASPMIRVRNLSVRNLQGFDDATSASGFSRGDNGQMIHPDGNFGRKPDVRGGLQMASRASRDDSGMPGKGLHIRDDGSTKHGFSDAKDNLRGNQRQLGKYQRAIRNTKDRIRGMGDALTDQVNNNRTKMSDMGQAFRKFGRGVKKFTPSIMTWWKLLAVLLPMMIGLAVQGLAVAAAFTAIAGAGALMVGAGIFGMGENLAEGFGHAERKLNRLKREMFQAFKPTLEIFEPISSEFLDKLPQRIAPLADALKGITVFEDGFIKIFEGAVGWAAGVIESAQQYADVLEKITMQYGGELADRLGRFMVFLIETAEENATVFFKLMDIFTAVINTVWQLLKVVIYVATVFTPLFNIVSKIATILSNKFIVGLLGAVATFWLVSGAITSATAALAGFGGVMGVLSFGNLIKTLGGIAGMFTFVAKEIWGAIIAMETWKAVATLGASLVVGGLAYKSVQNAADDARSSGSNTGGGSNNTYNTEINVSGKDAKEAGRRLEEDFPELFAQEVGRRDSQDMG